MVMLAYIRLKTASYLSGKHLERFNGKRQTAKAMKTYKQTNTH